MDGKSPRNASCGLSPRHTAWRSASIGSNLVKQGKGKVATDGVRRIYVAFRIIQVSQIFMPEQTFRCRFDLYVEWMDLDMSKLTSREFEASDMEHFEPIIRYTNADWYEEGRKIYMTFPSSKFVGFRVTISGVFRTELDLASFPFDTQQLMIELTLGVDRGSNELLHYAVAQFRDATNHANVLMRQIIPEYAFRPLRYRITRTTKSEGVDGLEMSQYQVVIPVRRRPESYIVNIYSVVGLIQIMMLGVFSMEHENEERLRLGVTLFIVLAAFKLQIANTVPKVVVMTHIDKYMGSAFLFCFGVYAYTSIGVFVGKNMSKGTDRMIFCVSFGIFILLQIYFAVLAISQKNSHAKRLKSFGRVDPEAISFLIEDGYKFANGVLTGDLDFTKSKGPDMTAQYDKEEGAYGNPERWATRGPTVGERASKRPSLSSNLSTTSI